MKKNKLNLTFREAEFSVGVRQDGETEVKELRASVSSETPYFRHGLWDAESKSFVPGYEVLGHEESEIDFGRMKDGLVIQDNHWGDQVGLMNDIEVKDGKLSGTIIFGCGERSQEIKRDAEAGIRRNMSVGYRIFEMKKVGKAEDGYPIFRATKWQPFEASFVNVPADTEIGVGRSLEQGEEIASIATTNERESKMETPETPKAVGVTADEVREIVKEGCDSIRAEFAKKPEMPEAKRSVQFNEAESATIAKRYNMGAVIRAMAGEKVDIGFERELSDEIAKQTNKQARGMFIPDVAFRALTGKTNVSGQVTGNGAALVAQEMGSYIDALVAKTVLGQAGVTVLDGLVGDIALPKGGAVTAAWLSGENGEAADGAPNFSQVLGTPHTISAKVDVSRKLLLQSSMAVQSLISSLLVDSLARGIEAAAFDGAGTNGAPTGISATTGINAVTMTAGAPTKANLVEFWEKVLGANVADVNMKYIGSPAVKALLAKTLDYFGINASGQKASSSVVGGIGGGYLCTKDSKVEGYDFLMSGLCNSKKLYFGDWSQMCLAFWSGIDLTVDPYSLSTKGALRLVAFQDADILVRHPQAFAVGTALA